MILSRKLHWMLLAFSLISFLTITDDDTFAKNVTAVHHDLQIILNLDSHELAGTDEVRVNPANKELVFSLNPKARISEISINGRTLPFAFREGNLVIQIPDEMTQKEAVLKIAYKAVFNDPYPDLPVNTDNPGYGVNGTISKEGVFILDGAGWYPDLSDSKSSFLLHVLAPKGFLAVTAGDLIGHSTKGEMTLSEWQCNFPVEGLSLSAGPYVVKEKKAGAIKVFTYFFSDTVSLADKYLDAAVRYIALYNHLLGPYPFEKFAVVENFFQTGYGFPSYTLLGSEVIKLPFIIDISLGHEIAHSWWGNGVFVDYTRGNWSEGLTTYVADYHYKEMSSPQEAAEYRKGILMDYSTLVPPQKDFPLSAFQSRTDPATRAVGYGKAAMVFHMVRRLIGEEAFWGGLRDIYKAKLFRKASWADFRLAFEKRSKLDLRSYFHEWVALKGAPSLALTDVKADRLHGEWITGARLLERNKSKFEFNIPVRLQTAAGSTTSDFHVTKAISPLELKSKKPPILIAADENADVFRRLDDSEIPPTVNSLKASHSLKIVIPAKTSHEVREAVKILALGLGQEKAGILEEGRITPGLLKKNDLLIVGWPEQEELRETIKQNFEIAPDSFKADKKVYDQPGDVFLGVARNSQKTYISIFYPLSEKKAALVARKIPHYGKFSYLAFKNGEISDKGLTQPRKSPLTVKLEASP